MKLNLTSPLYRDENKAREHLESLLWPDGPVCPRCNATGDRVTKLAGKSTRPGVFKCKDCRKPFSVTVGTVMERSHIPLTKWLLAAHFMASSKKGVSAHQLHRMLDTTYETAWFLAHRLRECMKGFNPGPLGGVVTPLSDQAQTRMVLVSLFAALVQTLGEQDKSVLPRFEGHLERYYYSLRDAGSEYLPVLEAFRLLRELTKP